MQRELPFDNALGLVEETPKATQLQRKISDLVLRGSLSGAARERGIRELIQEIHAFLASEPLDRVSSTINSLFTDKLIFPF